MNSTAYAAPGPTETLRALPTLSPGVTVETLRRVWFATPADRKHQRSSLLESIVTVDCGSHVEAKPLRDLSLAEVERAIGAITPRWRVDFYDPKKSGTQVATFVDDADALTFAAGKMFRGVTATVKPIGAIR